MAAEPPGPRPVDADALAVIVTVREMGRPRLPCLSNPTYRTV